MVFSFSFFPWLFPNFHRGHGDESYSSLLTGASRSPQLDPFVSTSCVLSEETRSKMLSTHCGEDSPGFPSNAFRMDTL